MFRIEIPNTLAPFNQERGCLMQNWEYKVAPLEEAGKLKKKSPSIEPTGLNELGAEGWEAVGITLKRGDLVAWPVVLLKRPAGRPTEIS